MNIKQIKLLRLARQAYPGIVEIVEYGLFGWTIVLKNDKHGFTRQPIQLGRHFDIAVFNLETLIRSESNDSDNQ